MNGAESLVRTLVGGGVDVCFANRGGLLHLAPPWPPTGASRRWSMDGVPARGYLYFRGRQARRDPEDRKVNANGPNAV